MAYADKEKEHQYQRTYQLQKYLRWRKEAREKLGGQCAWCGFKENLQFDHIDPTSKSFTLGSTRPGKEAWDAEVAKCQLLCVDCHKKKTSSEQRIDVHGTWGMWRNRKCRCEICKDFVRNYQREHDRKKRAAVALLDKGQPDFQSGHDAGSIPVCGT